ncbi:MAG: UvrB/UvrC motif-containing protein, partial [Spirochaetaceae bacterium]|nr:UvrB/UvrC motif-containing protein [Spirochaetaceae bacterium]
ANILERHIEEDKADAKKSIEVLKKSFNVLVPKERKKLITSLNTEMLEYAKNLEFEKAAEIRDEIARIKDLGKV